VLLRSRQRVLVEMVTLRTTRRRSTTEKTSLRNLPRGGDSSRVRAGTEQPSSRHRGHGHRRSTRTTEDSPSETGNRTRETATDKSGDSSSQRFTNPR
jgi:hypothetical protein